jgi:hypothetical protein
VAEDTMSTRDGAPDELPVERAEAPTDPLEGAVPPGYDWPTHGGYLGCLLGVVVACVLGGFLGSFLVGLASVTPLGFLVGSAPARIAIIVGVFLLTLVGLGRVGWALGKRFYREYPRPTRRARFPYPD